MWELFLALFSPYDRIVGKGGEEMNLYLISYDLNYRGKDYSRLTKTIEGLGDSCHALESEWFVCSSLSEEQIYNKLQGSIDGGDYLFINKLNGGYSAQISP